jgi:hypothetical protein
MEQRRSKGIKGAAHEDGPECVSDTYTQGRYQEVSKAWRYAKLQTTEALLVLSSLNTITKESAIAAMILGRTSPDPGVGPQVELRGRHTSGLFDLFGVGKALASEGIAAEEPPPALLQIEPARPGGDEDMMDAWMIDQPGAGLETVVTGEIIADDEDISRRIVGFDVCEQGDVAAFRCAKLHTWSVPCHRAPVAPHRPRFSRARVHSPAAL